MSKKPQECAAEFFSGNGATYDHIANISTLGLDGCWKRKMIKKLPANPTRIIEQASGTGILTSTIARLFPACSITGVELHQGYVNIAKRKAEALNQTNVEFIHGRAEDVVLAGEADCILSAYLAKYVELDLLVAHAAKMLRKDGVLIMHELTRPTNPVFLPLWNLHFRLLRLYGKVKHPEWSTAFADLPSLLAKTRWVDELVGALRANKFSQIKVERLFFGVSAIVSARK